MMIGGSDIVFEVPPHVPVADLILARVRRLWPDALFQDEEEEEDQYHPIRGTWVLVHGGRSKSFFIYRDRAAVKAWDREGGTLKNLNVMLFFMIGDKPADDLPREMTMACGERTQEISRLIDDLEQSFHSSPLPTVQAA